MDLKTRLFDVLAIELQSNCNLSCWFCARTYDKSGVYFEKDGKRIIKAMPTENILSILDQAKEMGFKGRVTLHHLSEPFLDKRAIDIAWEIRNRGMFPIVNTNGIVLKKDLELCQRISKVFHHVVVGIYELETKEEIEAEKEYWYKRLEGTNVYFSIIPPVKPSEVDPEFKEGAMQRYGVPSDDRMVINMKSEFVKAPCHRGMERLLIKYDGNVALCCEDYPSGFGLGNAFDTPIKDIWFSEHRLEIIQNLIDGKRELYKICAACPLDGTKEPRNWEPIKEEASASV